MIKSFRSAETRALYETGKSKRFGAITAVATRKLTQLHAGTVAFGYRQQYGVAPDGRFLINVSVDESTAAPITVITNWNPEAKK